MKKLLSLILFTLLLSNISQAADFYWFGSVSGLGSGNWSTPSCWSPNSTGTPRYTTEQPSSVDNVYFIGSSFGSSGQTLTINVPANFNTLSISGDVLPFNFNNQFGLNCNGSLYLTNAVSFTNTITGNFNFRGRIIGNEIIHAGVCSKLDFSFDAPSGSYIIDNVKCKALRKFGIGTLSITGNSFVSFMTLNSGNTFISGTITGSSLIFSNVLYPFIGPLLLNIENSILNLDVGIGYDPLVPASRIGNVTVSGIGSLINISGINGAIMNLPPGASNIYKFGNLEFSNASKNPSINSTNSQTFFDDVLINGNSSLNQNFSILGSNLFKNLKVIGIGQKLILQSGKTQTILNSFDYTSNSCQPITLQSSSVGGQAFVSLLGSNFNTDYIRVRDINTSGNVPFVAGPNSVNLGNNTNWTFLTTSSSNFGAGLGNDVAICTNPYTISPNGFGKYNSIKWFDNSTANSFTVTTSGLYTATVNFGTGSGCNFVDDIQVTILPKPSPIITGPTTVGINQSNVVYSTSSVSGNTFSWTIPGFVSLNSPSNRESINVSFANFTTGSFIVQSSNTIPGCIGTASLRVESTTTSTSIPTCTTPSLVISGSLSVCPSVSGFYSIKSPNRTSIYTWSIAGQAFISAGQGASRVFVTFGQNVLDQISVQERTKDGCLGQVSAVQVAQSSGRYSLPALELNCSTTLFTVPLLVTSSIPSGITAMDLTLSYDFLSVTPTGVSFLGNVVRRNYANNAISLYTDFTEPGVVRVSISYSALAPVTANFAGLGTIIGFNFNRLPLFTPGATTSIRITELIEGNLAGINYQCGNEGVVSLKNNEISGAITHILNNRGLFYNSANPTQFNATRISATDIFCQPTTYSVLPDILGNFKFNIDNGEKLTIGRDVPGSYYSGSIALNVQSVINSSDAVQISNFLINPFTTNWKQISLNRNKLAQVYAADVDMDGLVTSLDLFYVQKRSVLQIKEYPQAWNYTDGIPNNTTDLSKDWLFVDKVKFDELASTLNRISILPSLPDCLDEPVPSNSSCIPVGSISYQGILLGDVDGNWNQAPLNSNAIRSSNENQLVVGLDSAIAVNNGYLIPLQIQYADSVKAIDFNFGYDSTQFIVAEVKPTFDAIANNFIWNNFYNKTILAGAYSSDTFSKNLPIYYLKLLSSVPITETSFKEFKSYINGNEVPVVYRQALVTGNSDEHYSSYVNVYPNPTNGSLSVIGKNWGSETVIAELNNSSGQLVQTFEIPVQLSSINSELDLTTVTDGIYFLKLKSDKLIKVIKLIKQ